MVHREKNFNLPPAALVHSKWNTLKSNLLIERSDHDVKTECFRETTINSLMLLYKYKCAMCERNRGTELQVDHYRPKKPRSFISNNQYNQPGYYWLAYEWMNLIPLCSKCNNNKSNKFPLAGWNENNRISDFQNINNIQEFEPRDLNWLQIHECPLIVNPEYDATPEKHFSFRANGEIIGRTDEGIETINICKLNRKDLKRERLKIRNDYVNDIKDAFDGFITHRNRGEFRGEIRAAYKKIKKNTDKDREHSYYNTFIYKYFEYFIGSKLPESIKIKSIEYFNEYKANGI